MNTCTPCYYSLNVASVNFAVCSYEWQNAYDAIYEGLFINTNGKLFYVDELSKYHYLSSILDQNIYIILTLIV